MTRRGKISGCAYIRGVREKGRERGKSKDALRIKLFFYLILYLLVKMMQYVGWGEELVVVE